MFSVSSRARYGLSALIHLAQNFRQGLCQAREIAAVEAIPQHFLEQIFSQLVKAGIVQSVRGKKGGYALLKSPDAVTVFEVLSILDGENEKLQGNKADSDAVSELSQQANALLRDFLRVSLAELTRRQSALRGASMFHI